MKGLGNAVSALSILFVLAALLRTDFTAFAITDWKWFLLLCCMSVFLKACTVFLSGSAWYRWLELFSNKRCRRREALRVYAKANIGKYLPGNVMHYVERNLFAGKLEMSQKQLAAASISEVAGLALSACLLGAALAYPSYPAIRRAFAAAGQETARTYNRLWQLFSSGLALGAVAAAAAAVWLAYRLYHAKKYSAGPRDAADANMPKQQAQNTGGRSPGTQNKPAEWLCGLVGFGKTCLVCVCTYVAVLAVLGSILALIYWYWEGWPGFGKAAYMVAAYALAWAAGFLMPGAPGGIGVREMVLSVLLSPVAGQGRTAAFSVLHRLITVAGDFAAYLLRKAI